MKAANLHALLSRSRAFAIVGAYIEAQERLRDAGCLVAIDNPLRRHCNAIVGGEFDFCEVYRDPTPRIYRRGLARAARELRAVARSGYAVY